MLTSAFIYIASYIASLILAVFPASSGLPTQFTDALATIGGYVGMLDPLVPIDTLVSVLTIILTYEFILFSFKALAWLYHKIPLIGK